MKNILALTFLLAFTTLFGQKNIALNQKIYPKKDNKSQVYIAKKASDGNNYQLVISKKSLRSFLNYKIGHKQFDVCGEQEMKKFREVHLYNLDNTLIEDNNSRTINLRSNKGIRDDFKSHKLIDECHLIDYFIQQGRLAVIDEQENTLKKLYLKESYRDSNDCSRPQLVKTYYLDQEMTNPLIEDIAKCVD